MRVRPGSRCGTGATQREARVLLEMLHIEVVDKTKWSICFYLLVSTAQMLGRNPGAKESTISRISIHSYLLKCRFKILLCTVTNRPLPGENKLAS